MNIPNTAFVGAMQGTIYHEFDYFYMIRLPDGRRVRVSRESVTEENGHYYLDEDTEIREDDILAPAAKSHSEGSPVERTMPVLVPGSVMKRIDAYQASAQ